MAKREAIQNKQVVSPEARDLGDATTETKGYNFDYVQEIQPYDKKYNRT
ncbi:hypothetical protein N185_15660 [Sinorhizobium sp. GW3]|nr:hypothetical protein N185_15660 [Sinorhizobium sp. GW3]